MSKQKIMRGGVLVLMIILCMSMASAVVYFNESFDTGSGSCTDFDISGGTCNYAGGFASISNTGTQRTNFALSPSITSGSYPTHTTSYIARYTGFSGSTNSMTELSEVNSPTIMTYFISTDTHLYINSQTTVTKSDLLNNWVSFDMVYNATDNQVYTYVNGILKKIATPSNSANDYTNLQFRNYNILDIDNVVIQDGVHINTDYTPSTCNDGLDNDGDGFTDSEFDPDCDGDLDAEEDVYNSQSGLFWTQDFSETSVDCSEYGISVANGIYTPNQHTCSVSSGQMNIGNVNRYIDVPFIAGVMSSDRKTENYTITLRMKYSTRGNENSYIYFRDLPSTASVFQTMRSGSTSGTEFLQFGGANTDFNLSNNLDTWHYYEFFHNVSDNKVYFYIDGEYKKASTIDNLAGSSDISSVTFRNDYFSGGSLLNALQIQIDEMRFSWGDTVGEVLITGCTDGADNDGDGFIDEADPDCETGDEEINFDLYPIQIFTNVTVFTDHFDNENYTSEGWIDNTGGCIEGIGQASDHTIYKNGAGECQLNTNITIGDYDKQLYSLDFFSFGYGNANHFHIGDTKENALTFEFLEAPPLNTTGQVLYLPFNEDFNDYSGLGNDGNSFGNVNINSFGFNNYSAEFDGNNDWVGVPDSTSLEITEDISIIYDVYLIDHIGSNMQFIRGTPSSQYGVLSGATGGLVLYMAGNVRATGYSLDLDTWYNIAITRDYATGNLSVLVNGIPIYSVIDNDLFPITTDDIIIGDYTGSDFHGFIDEFRIFNRSLSVEEVQDYNDLEVMHVTGLGDCTLASPIAYSTFTHLLPNVSYNFEFMVDQTAGTGDIYIEHQYFTTITDADCFDMDDTVYAGFRIVEPFIEIDQFTVTNIDTEFTCYDDIDNDGDGFIDYPEDPDCTLPSDNEDTIDKWDCNDGIDNDNDGYTDYPDDEGCSQHFENDELPKQGTACEDNECSETQNCILDHSFECTASIENYGFTTNPDWYAHFVEGEIYNSRTVIGLHEFLGYSVILDNGSLEQADNITYYKEFSSNTKDYEIIDNKFDLFFDYQYEESGITVQDISNEFIDIKYYFSDYTITNKMLEVVMKPLSYNNEIWVKVYTVDEFGYEYLVGTMRTADSHDNGRVEFHIEMDTTEQSYRLWWEDGIGISDKSEPVDYDIYTYDYPDRFSMDVGGDPMYYSTQLKAESKMYLNNIEVYGSQKDTTTVCDEWEAPYHLIEEFNGFAENCGWSVNPSNIYFNGKLYITEDLDVFNADKDFAGIYKTDSRYATLDLTAVAYEYADEIGYTLVEMMDDNHDPVFAIYFSENSAEDGGTVGYYTDGDFIELAEFNYSETQRVYVIYDFNTATFELLHRGQYTTLQSLGSGLELVDPSLNPTEISNLKIFSYRGTYSLDSIKFYTSDSEAHIISLTDTTAKEVTDPYPLMAGDSWCGYIDTQADTKSCLSDSECGTGHCNKAEGTCSGFDYTYCDEKGKTRGNGCVVSAMVGCGLESAGSLMLDNFFLVIVAVAILMFLTYFIIILKN